MGASDFAPSLPPALRAREGICEQLLKEALKKRYFRHSSESWNPLKSMKGHQQQGKGPLPLQAGVTGVIQRFIKC